MTYLIKLIKSIISNFKYNWSYLGVLNSPFARLRLKWYFGDIIHGTPYFLPRKMVKMTRDDCESSLRDDIKRCLPKYVEGRTWEYYKNHKKFVPIKYFGINFTSLGWKTKWDNYRFEWNPCYSLVIFGKQLFVVVLPNVGDDCLRWDVYWEAWLNYEYKTDKTKSMDERFNELIKNHSCTWTGNEGEIDYYPLILNKKYKEKYDRQNIR